MVIQDELDKILSELVVHEISSKYVLGGIVTTLTGEEIDVPGNIVRLFMDYDHKNPPYITPEQESQLIELRNLINGGSLLNLILNQRKLKAEIKIVSSHLLKELFGNSSS